MGLLFGIFAGVTQSAPAKKLVVGFSQIGAESAWRTAETESIVSEAKKRGVELKLSDTIDSVSAEIGRAHV